MYLQKSFSLPQYKCHVRFFVVENIPKKVARLEKKHTRKVIDYDKADSGGLHFAFDIHEYFIILRSDCVSSYYITHELIHFIEAMQHDRGIGEEERAYLMGYLTEEIQLFLKSKKVKL